MIVKLLTEHHLEFLSLKGGCRGWSESTHVEMPHCWKSHALAQIVGTLCAQLLQFYADCFETLQMFWSWSEHVHNYWILSSGYDLLLFFAS